MENIINYFLYFLFWLALTGMPAGFLGGFFAVTAPLLNLYIVSKLGLLPQNIRLNRQFFGYSLWLFKEIIQSAIDVIKLVYSGYKTGDDNICKIKHQQKNNAGSVMYANSITLTPGTLTLAIDGNEFTVHGLAKGFLSPLKSKSQMATKVKQVTDL